MALRDQPYLKLYIKDVTTDEKLIECSAEAHGVYFRLLCILPKQETYGLLLLKQKYKQNSNKIDAFATMLKKQLPWELSVIISGLTELVEEKVIRIEGHSLIQNRMLRDGKISEARAKAGSAGGSGAVKNYGKEGYAFLMSDGLGKHRVGVSKNPKNRLYRLRSDLKLPKYFKLHYMIPVSNMGSWEDKIIERYENQYDGDWIKGDFKEILQSFMEMDDKKPSMPEQGPVEDPVIVEELIDDGFYAKKEELIKVLCDQLGFGELQYASKRKVMQFVNSQIKNDAIYNHFLIQFQYYYKYKKLSKEKTHQFDGLFGTESQAWADGAWNKENWKLKTDQYIADHLVDSKFSRTAAAYNGAKNPYET